MTDANMRAADAHYAADRPSDFDFCDRCGRPFNLADIDGCKWDQHPRLFMLCDDCGNEMENGRE